MYQAALCKRVPDHVYGKVTFKLERVIRREGSASDPIEPFQALERIHKMMKDEPEELEHFIEFYDVKDDSNGIYFRIK